LAYRKEQFEELQRGMAQCGLKLGDVTTVNLTVLKAGVTSDGGKTFSINVIPTMAEAYFDIRVPPSVNLVEFKEQLAKWSSEEGATFEIVNGGMINNQTSVGDDNKWWKVFQGILDKLNCKIDLQIFPAATDSRYIRNKGIPALGFSPMNHTKVLLHDHNEYLNEDTFLKGIDIFVEIITALANSKH